MSVITLKSVTKAVKAAIASSVTNAEKVAVASIAATGWAILHGNTDPMTELVRGLSPSDRANFGAFFQNLNKEMIDRLVPETEQAGLKLLSDKGNIAGFSFDKETRSIKINTSSNGKLLYKAIREQEIMIDGVDSAVTIDWIIDQISSVKFMEEKAGDDAVGKAFDGDVAYKALIKRIVTTEKDQAKARHDVNVINKLIVNGRFPQADIDSMFAAAAKAKADKATASAANDTKAPLVIDHKPEQESAAG